VKKTRSGGGEFDGGEFSEGEVVRAEALVVDESGGDGSGVSLNSTWGLSCSSFDSPSSRLTPVQSVESTQQCHPHPRYWKTDCCPHGTT